MNVKEFENVDILLKERVTLANTDKNVYESLQFVHDYVFTCEYKAKIYRQKVIA